MNHRAGLSTRTDKRNTKELNLSQEEFAKKLGVSFTSVNRWENGQTKPSKLARRQILNLLEHITEYVTSANLKG